MSLTNEEVDKLRKTAELLNKEVKNLKKVIKVVLKDTEQLVQETDKLRNEDIAANEFDKAERLRMKWELGGR